MIRNIILLCVTIFIFSCEKESSSNSLKITLDAVIQKSDSIAIYYTTDNSVAFHKESSYWIDVKGIKKIKQLVLYSQIPLNQNKLESILVATKNNLKLY